MVQLWFSVGSVVGGMRLLGPIQLWFSCGSVWLLFDVCGSVWCSCGLAWCGIAPLRFSFGSAWCGMILYGSAQVQLRFSLGSAIGDSICRCLRFGSVVWIMRGMLVRWTASGHSTQSLAQQGQSGQQLS